MTIALTLLLGVFQQQDTGEQFYKFKVGTTWTLIAKERSGKQSKAVLTVDKEEEGKTYLTSKTQTVPEGKVREQHARWFVENNLLIWEEKSPDAKDWKTSFTPYKIGSKKGDTWGEAPKVLEHMGTVDLTVLAGTFKDTVHVKCTLDVPWAKGEDKKMEVHIYLAPKVGVVKLDAAEGGLELESFKQGP